VMKVEGGMQIGCKSHPFPFITSPLLPWLLES
jgi:hypothetical protein